MAASQLLQVIGTLVTKSDTEVNGKIITAPQLLVTDGDSTTYACDVDIGEGDISKVLKNVPLARSGYETRYAQPGNACRLRRTYTGQWEVVGFSKEAPGRYEVFDVVLDGLSFGPRQDRTIVARPLYYNELATYGGYGVVPYGAVGIFVGGVLQEIR
jgi:hypothetical protein